MAVVTETLLNLLRKQVRNCGTVVWYDPEGVYTGIVQSLTPETAAGAAVYRYEGERGFVWLRRQLEPLWEKRTDPPRLLIYVPLTQAETPQLLPQAHVVHIHAQGCSSPRRTPTEL